MSKFKRNTHFVAGFSFQGKRESNVGEDLLSVLVSGDDAGDELMDGTPLKITGLNGGSTAIDSDDYVSRSAAQRFEVEVVDAGEDFDLILYSRISDELTDFEWLMTDIMRDEVKPDDPATGVLKRGGQIIATRLYDGLTEGDDVEVGDIGGGEIGYITQDAGEKVGEVLSIMDSPDIKDSDDDFALIKLV